jgi:hypothetical protein
MIDILLSLGLNKYDSWRILQVKCYIENFVRFAELHTKRQQSPTQNQRLPGDATRDPGCVLGWGSEKGWL